MEKTPSITLTNGAAHWALQLVNGTLCSMDDLFHSGGLSLKLKCAGVLPFREEDESDHAYTTRVQAWLEQDFAPIDITQGERDYMRKLLKEKGKANQLPGVYHVANLAKAFDLDKP